MTFATLMQHASAHLGLLRTSDASAHGVPRIQLDRLVNRGLLQFLGRDVWRVTGSCATWDQKLLAACWRTGGAGLASGPAAVAVYGLWGARHCTPEVMVLKGTGANLPGVRKRQTRWLTGSDISTLGPIPVTSPERTVIDIAALRQPRRTEEVLDDVVHKGLSTAQRIADHLGAMPTRGRTGARHLWELLAERTGDPDGRTNAWENAMARLLASNDLPRPVRQHKVVVGSAVYYLDFAWPEHKVAVECDSVLAHSSGPAFRYDLDRQHDCESLGWTFKRFVPSQLRDDPQGILGKIRHQLLAAGWKTS